MATQSRWHDVVTALVALCRAQPGYRAPDATGDVAGDVLVFDGPEYVTTADPAGVFLVVGWGGTTDDPESPGEVSQSAGPHAPTRPRDESGLVRCRAVAQTGQSGVGAPAAARASALGVLEDVAELVRGNPTLGLSPVDPQRFLMRARFVAGSPLQYQRSGVVCEWSFEIRYETSL